jgi:pyruvate dehydrogenase E2 component (dihydrolipoyllysine-residue acetyltransferase)
LAATEVKVPDIGDFKEIPVIELLVKAGDTVKKDDSLLVLESDKATMEVPAPAAGVIAELKVKVGDKVSAGTLVALLEGGVGAGAAPAVTNGNGKAKTAGASPPPTQPQNPQTGSEPPQADPPGGSGVRSGGQSPSERDANSPAPATPKAVGPAAAASAAETPATSPAAAEGAIAHASPGVRRFARELGVPLGQVTSSGPKGRILKEDIQSFVKQAIAGGASARGGGGLADLGLPPWPKVDFAKFGPVETLARTRIQKISAPGLARNWVMIPHVTQFDEADVTELEAFRAHVNEENAKAGVKVSPLAFLMKAVVAALKKHPTLNSSLDGENLIIKQYWNIGFAADTPQGLVVPVLKDVDKKGILEIAKETAELAAKARDGKLGPNDIQGATFTISSLGGIGGTAFTPIINAPEVAILGVSRSAVKPVWNGKEFAPRTMLPLSLSYDHRVVDGALAARFITYLGQVIADIRRVML